MSIDFTPAIAWQNKLIKNRGQRANLKRCKKLTAIFLQPAYVELCQQLHQQGEKVALIAGVLSHTKDGIHNKDTTFAKQMASMKKGGHDAPRISPIRFRQLLAIKDYEKLFHLLIQIIPQIESFNLEKFATDLFFWGDRSKKDWAYAYYSTYSDDTNQTQQGEAV